MTPIYEEEVEDWTISLLQEQGYSRLSSKEQETGRSGFSDALLRRRV